MKSKSGAAPARKTAGGSLKAADARRKTRRIASTKKAAARKKIQSANGKPVSKGRGRQKKGAAGEDAINEFRRVVNIAPLQLERWLGTSDSKKLVRLDASGGAVTDSDPGRLILRILKKRRDSYTVEDFNLMQTVAGEIDRRLSERPKGDIVASNWRYSLMNWGHDPSKPLKRIRGGDENDK